MLHCAKVGTGTITPVEKMPFILLSIKNHYNIIHIITIIIIITLIAVKQNNSRERYDNKQNKKSHKQLITDTRKKKEGKAKKSKQHISKEKQP